MWGSPEGVLFNVDGPNCVQPLTRASTTPCPMKMVMMDFESILSGRVGADCRACGITMSALSVFFL
jgi:hypothetical protein